MDTRLYWIWLQQALGQGNPLASRLLAQYPRVRHIYEADGEELQALKCDPKVLERLCDKSLTQAKRILSAALQENGWVLTPDDDYYPSLLRAIYGMPLVLYGRGTMPDLDMFPAVSVIGTRKPSEYGREIAWTLGAGLATGGLILVNGGTLGIETAAIEGALEANGIVVDVQACGLGREYPLPNTQLRRRIAQKGAVLSEYPPDVTYPQFQVRNRLISGMTWGVCAVEGERGSGSMSIAVYAREQGRDVFAIPGAVTSRLSDAPNHLIQEGAKLVYRAADILEEYESRFPEILDKQAAIDSEEGIRKAFRRQHAVTTIYREPPVSKRETGVRLRVADASAEALSRPTASAVCPDTVSPTVRKVWEALKEHPTPIDELAQTVSLTVPQVLAALTELEILGCARGCAGQSYCRN